MVASLIVINNWYTTNKGENPIFSDRVYKGK